MLIFKYLRAHRFYKSFCFPFSKWQRKRASEKIAANKLLLSQTGDDQKMV